MPLRPLFVSIFPLRFLDERTVKYFCVRWAHYDIPEVHLSKCPYIYIYDGTSMLVAALVKCFFTVVYRHL